MTNGVDDFQLERGQFPEGGGGLLTDGFKFSGLPLAGAGTAADFRQQFLDAQQRISDDADLRGMIAGQFRRVSVNAD